MNMLYMTQKHEIKNEQQQKACKCVRTTVKVLGTQSNEVQSDNSSKWPLNANSCVTSDR